MRPLEENIPTNFFTQCRAELKDQRLKRSNIDFSRTSKAKKFLTSTFEIREEKMYN